jgi:hypothetical protein
MSIKINGKTVAGNYKSHLLETATTDVFGLIRIATDEEVAEGTSNKVAITPLQLAQKQPNLIAGEGIVIEDGVISSSTIIFRDWTSDTPESDTPEINN